MRLVACLTMCLMPILADAAQTDAQDPSDPQAYCVDRSANLAVPREQCGAIAGTVELPFEGGRHPQAPKPMK